MRVGFDVTFVDFQVLVDDDDGERVAGVSWPNMSQSTTNKQTHTAKPVSR